MTSLKWKWIQWKQSFLLDLFEVKCKWNLSNVGAYQSEQIAEQEECFSLKLYCHFYIELWKIVLGGSTLKIPTQTVNLHEDLSGTIYSESCISMAQRRSLVTYNMFHMICIQNSITGLWLPQFYFTVPQRGSTTCAEGPPRFIGDS